MRFARIWGLIAVIVAVMAFPAVTLAQPAPPHVFVGSATQGDVPAADGTEVTAWIDGIQVGTGTVTGDQYKVQVIQPEGQFFDGKTVTFQVAGLDVPETAIWEVGGATEVNLSSPASEQPAVNTQPNPQPAQNAQPQPELISEPVEPEPPVINAEEGKKRRAFVGVVDGEPDATVDVVRKDTGERVTIRLKAYRLKMPGKSLAGSFKHGSRVVILTQRDGDDWVAIWVLVKPRKLVNRPVVGTVVGVEDGVLSIIQPDGTTTTLELPEGVQTPEAGEVITLFAGGEIRGRLKVKGLVKASKIRGRLERFLRELTTGEVGAPQGKAGAKLTSARKRAEAARENALAALAEADAARARAEAAQPGDAEDLNERAAEAEENAAEAEVELAEAEAQVADIQAEAAEKAAKAEMKAAERRAKRVSDVASILDTLTAQHTEILRSLAQRNILPAEALRGIAIALDNAKRDRSQATLRAAEARTKSEDRKRKTRIRAEERWKKARAKAVETRKKAQAKAAEKRAKHQARVERRRLKAQAELVRGTAIVKVVRDRGTAKAIAEQDREAAIVIVVRDQEAAKARAEQDREAAKAKVDREREAAQAKAEREREAARVKAEQDREAAPSREK